MLSRNEKVWIAGGFMLLGAGVLYLLLKKGAGGLAYEVVTYTGKGDGTPNPVTFKSKPRQIIFASNTPSDNLECAGNDSVITALPSGGGDTIVKESRLFSSNIVDVDALRALFPNIASDINALSVAYTAFAIG